MRGGPCICAVLMLLLVVGGKAALLRLRDDDDDPKQLSLPGLTGEQYMEFLAELRESLGSIEQASGLPVLRSANDVPSPSQRFVFVTITNYGWETATLALDVTNAYIVGYRVGELHSFFTMPDNPNDDEAISHLFQGTERHTFPFTGSYIDLEAAAGEDVRRETVALGAGALDAAVRTMNLYAERPTATILHSVARGLIVCIQMISEAARFRYIGFEMRSRIDRGVDSEPDPSVIRLENSWSALSQQIQTSSSNGGVFERAIQLQRRDYSLFQVSDVRTVRPLIGLLLFYCKTTASTAAAATLAVSSRRLADEDVHEDPTCPLPAPSTWRIVGPDGLCVDVRDGQYNNGNPVQLWPCSNSNQDQINQLWTFSSDGTLRSNGKCLASYGYTPGDYIMIYDCEPGVDAFTWHSWPNGTIVSPSGLVLSAHSTAAGTTLTARENAYTTGQSWLPTNATDDAEVAASSIYQIANGFSAGAWTLCLTAADDALIIRECEFVEEGSWWALYPDSSIRPADHQARQLCLAAAGTDENEPLKMVSCNPNSSLQRWLFGNDGTVANLGIGGLVMDVTGPAESGARVALNAPAPGTDTQEWYPLL
ncbi:unnamed protein product [Urochloa humidicola]